MQAQVFHGRPADSQGRTEQEMRTYDFLDKLGIEYLRSDHIAAPTMEVCSAIDRGLGLPLYKNLFLSNRQQTKFYLLMMPGTKNFKTSIVSSQLGVSRLSFGNEEYMKQFLDIRPGSVSVMGLMNDRENRVQLLIDEEVLSGEYVGCHPCKNTSSIKIKTSDLLEKFLPAVHHTPIVVKL